MLMFNVLERVFFIQVGDATGTAFCIPWNTRTYLITAKHLFEGEPADKFNLFHADKWIPFSPHIELAESKIDIAVAQMPESFNPGFDIELGGQILMGEDSFVLGFPLRFYIDAQELTGGYPLPFAAKGNIAAVQRGSSSAEHPGIFLCGQIDEGYSGAPIVLQRRHEKVPRIIGVVSHNLRKRPSEKLIDGDRVMVSEPSNLIFGHHINAVTSLIESRFGSAPSP